MLVLRGTHPRDGSVAEGPPATLSEIRSSETLSAKGFSALAANFLSSDGSQGVPYLHPCIL